MTKRKLRLALAVCLVALAVVTLTWPIATVQATTPTCGDFPCGDGKFTVCHKGADGQGAPNDNELCIGSESSRVAHIAHGDCCGPCPCL